MLHDNDKSQLGCNHMPIVDVVFIFLWVSWRVPEITIPACGVVTKPSIWVSFASVFVVRDVEEGEAIVDVSLHGVVGVVAIGRDGEGPVVHQAGNHV